MINDIAHARSYARDLKRKLKPFGVGHLAAHDIAARTIGMRDWRTLSTTGTPSATRQDVEARLRSELASIHGVDAVAIIAALLPPTEAGVVSTPKVQPRRPHVDDGKIDVRPVELMHVFDGKQLDNVYHAIRMDHRGKGATWTRRMEECLQQGFFPRTSVEDLIDDSDHRLRIESIGMRLDRLMDRLGYSWTNMTDRPLAKATSAMMFKAISATEMAGFLIVLERMGFSVPAALMVERLLPDVKKRKALTPDELSIFWYAREKDKFHLRFVAKDVDRADSYGEGRLGNGYRYEVTTTSDQVRSLDVYGQRYRRRRSDR